MLHKKKAALVTGMVEHAAVLQKATVFQNTHTTVDSISLTNLHPFTVCLCIDYDLFQMICFLQLFFYQILFGLY